MRPVSHALVSAIAMLGTWPGTAPAQTTNQLPTSVPTGRQSLPWADAVAQWIALAATPGYERQATDVIAAGMSGWTRDGLGNLIRKQGTGAPRRVVACGLDEAGYVVSEMTADGYVRLQWSGRSRRSPLWDQFHEGQRVRILTRTGARPAVVGVRSTHLWRSRATSDPIVRVEDLWVDVGARSRAEVERIGIALLDPVIREWPQWRFADVVAGPGAADRAGCAAVAAASQDTPAQGETIFVLSVQHVFGYAGLKGVLSAIGPVDSLILVDPGLARDSGRESQDPVMRRGLAALPGPAAGARAGAVVAVGLRASFPGTLAEAVRAADVAALSDEVRRASGLAAGGTGQPVMMPSVPGAPPAAAADDSLTPTARLLAALSDVYGVSGREDLVRAAVQGALPAVWRRQPTTVDSAGNLIIAAGPDRDTVLFVAHLDEIGFEVAHIARDGMVTLAPLGGFYSSLWEGQPALLHLDSAARAGAARSACALMGPRSSSGASMAGPLRGLFIPREQATSKEPDTLRAWFGVDSAALAACGVTAGVRVSGYKSASRIGSVRLTARALDDRVGCTALLLALRSIDPARLRHKVIFVWSVREEVGLEGAAAVAAEIGPTLRRVHAVDTFVSSDSPLESPRFAHAVLGGGAALRALDNSSVTPPDEVARALRVGRAAGLPIQWGTTNGGNDGSEFVPWGEVDVALGWPMRYSHSPVEVIDLRDVSALAGLVAALAVAAPETAVTSPVVGALHTHPTRRPSR